jgi:hypothetical protein
MAGMDHPSFDEMKKESWEILPTSGVLWLWKKEFRGKRESPIWLNFEYNDKGEITSLQFGGDHLRFNQLKAFAELKKLKLNFEGE